MNTTTCYGCQNNCPGQLSHMDIGGCLYTESQPIKIIKKESKPEENYCVECGVNMGPNNPRQLCGKWRCHNDYKHQ